MIVYHTKYNTKSFHILLDNIATFLKNKKNAQIISEPNQSITYNNKEYKVYDCELLIHYPELDKFVGITFADYHSPLMSFFIERNKKDDILLSSQLGTTGLYNLVKTNNCSFTYKPSIYAPSYPYISLDEFFLKRTLKVNLIDKFVFRGNTKEGSFRHSAHLLKDSVWFDGCDYIQETPENYFDHIINYKVGLSIPGAGELCYRDVEYMALGIPFIKIKYISELNPPLIPNFHYISIDRFENQEEHNSNGGVISCERQGDERYAKSYLEKFLEIKDNKQFLSFISKNARKYYETYLHPINRFYHVIDLLELND